MLSRLLAPLAVLMAHVPAPCNGFLSSGKYVCANVSAVFGAKSQFDFLPVPLPHEFCDVRGDDPLRASRPSSWSPAYVSNSDEFPTCTQGAAISTSVLVRRLFHNACPPFPHDICARPHSDWPAVSDVDDRPPPGSAYSTWRSHTRSWAGVQLLLHRPLHPSPHGRDVCSASYRLLHGPGDLSTPRCPQWLLRFRAAPSSLSVFRRVGA